MAGKRSPGHPRRLLSGPQLRVDLGGSAGHLADQVVTATSALAALRQQHLAAGGGDSVAGLPLAHRALDADRRMGLLLPCNVVVRAADGQTFIEALNPQIMVEVTGQPSLKPVADEATSRIGATLDSLQDSGLPAR